MKKVLILAGAGASRFCNFTDKETVKFFDEKNDYKMPPLGNDLFDDLINNRYGKELNKLSDELKDIFRKEGFEKGMEECLSLIDDGKFLRESGNYFLRFYISKEDRENNLYYLFFKNLFNFFLNYRILLEYHISSLNYECLIEEAFNYINNGKNPNFQFIKPHGSSNFLPEIAFNPNFTFQSNTILGAGSYGSFGRTVSIQRVKALEYINNGNEAFIPVMSRYMQGKEGSLNNSCIEQHKKDFREAVEWADKIIVIGVRIVEEDIHIWDRLAKTKADICYVAPSGNDFKEWRTTNDRNHKYDMHIEGFRYMFKTRDSFQDSVYNFLVA